MADKRVLITGASGLLGRSVVSSMKESGWNVLGTAYSRAGTGLVKVDICNVDEVQKIVDEFKPHCIVHCAAQRFPDKVEKDKDGTIQLNVEATKNLAQLAAKAGATMLYISSDYVFDGTKPPYSEDDIPNPLNMYGETKLKGEVVTLEASSEHIVLRIPLLFGSVQYLGESAATCLIELLFKKDKKSISDCEIRYPSHVDDIAAICTQLLDLKLKGEKVKGIYHWGGKEAMTKYAMVVSMSQVFGLPMEHISPDPNPVPGAPRPHDAQLSTTKLEKLGIGKHTPFCDAIKSSLESWVERYKASQL